MRFDKFGIGALIAGLIILILTLHFGFSWTSAGIWAAFITFVIGGILWLSVILIIIGILLLIL